MKRNSFNHFWGHVVQQSKLSSSWEKEERSLQATQIVKQQRNDYRCGKNGSAFRNWPRSLLKMPIKSIEIIEGKIFRFANAIYLITRKNVIYVYRRQSHNAMQCGCNVWLFRWPNLSHKRTLVRWKIIEKSTILDFYEFRNDYMPFQLIFLFCHY